MRVRLLLVAAARWPAVAATRVRLLVAATRVGLLVAAARSPSCRRYALAFAFTLVQIYS